MLVHVIHYVRGVFFYLYPFRVIGVSIRKAKESLLPPSNVIDKTIIIEDTLPFGTDSMETQIHPCMEQLADDFDMEQPAPPSPHITTKSPRCDLDQSVHSTFYPFQIFILYGWPSNMDPIRHPNPNNMLHTTFLVLNKFVLSSKPVLTYPDS